MLCYIQSCTFSLSNNEQLLLWTSKTDVPNACSLSLCLFPTSCGSQPPSGPHRIGLSCSRRASRKVKPSQLGESFLIQAEDGEGGDDVFEECGGDSLYLLSCLYARCCAKNLQTIVPVLIPMLIQSSSLRWSLSPFSRWGKRPTWRICKLPEFTEQRSVGAGTPTLVCVTLSFGLILGPFIFLSLSEIIDARFIKPQDL